MATYLLDTNIALRFSNPVDAQHSLIADTIIKLLERGDECYLASQVLIEMWVVATRPTDVNGLGWSTGYTRKIIDELLARFPLADDVPSVFPTWLQFVTDNEIKGKRTHDARIVALMVESNISHILTLNPNDFSGASDIVVVHPQDIIHSG